MQTQYGRLAAAGAVAVVLLAAVLVFSAALSIQAAPLAAPTPISISYNSDNTRYPLNWFVTEVITQDTASAAIRLADYEALDIHYVIDQGETNTVTLKLQFSNDNSNWVDGVSLVSASTTDQNALQPFHNFGIWTRLYADVATSDALTVTAIGVAK
jgi:hypothetical protein